MNFEPQTYEELIRMKRCVELTKYYEVTEEELWEISWSRSRRLSSREADRICPSSSDRIPQKPRR